MDMEKIIVGIVAVAVIPMAAYLIKTLSAAAIIELQRRKTDAAAANKRLLSITYDVAQQVLDAVTRATVGRLEGETAAELREKVHAGEASYEDLQHLSVVAADAIINQLRPELKEALLDCVEDLDGYVRDYIEAVLPDIKAEYAQARATQNKTDAI